MLLKLITYGLMLLFSGNLVAQDKFQLQRTKMVEEQLIPRGIIDSATLQAMRNVPRHEFVPKEQISFAYVDHALSIGEGQTISQPYIVAYMTQSLNLKAGSRVLEIGTGSGYQAAVLAEITSEVYSIEIVPELAVKARATLARLGYSEISLKIADGYNGWKEFAPFDAIIVTAGAEEIPQPLIDQLVVGGRMIIPVGPNGGVRQLVQLDKKQKGVKKKNLMAVRFVPFTRPTDHR